MTRRAPTLNQRGIESVVELARTLIGIPSQGGIDPPGPIIDRLGGWLADRALDPEVLRSDDDAPVGLCVTLGRGRPRYCLNACLDTAPIGDRRSWSFPPTQAAVLGDWLGGRGSADCKTAISIFAHIGAQVASRGRDPAGSLVLLFDADEHTGRFGGVKAYTDHEEPLDGVMIGYPGEHEILVGARGFWRARLRVFGRSGHTGSRDRAADNAVVKAAALTETIEHLALPQEQDPDFSFGPKVTVTEIHGGHGYSIVPDVCTVAVDVRLTPSFDAAWAQALIRGACQAVDEMMPGGGPTVVEPDSSWPAYRLGGGSPIVIALRNSVRLVRGLDVPLRVAGPSNIGNYLASLGVDATCGFGVAYRNLHGADEAIDLRTVPPVYEIYFAAVSRLLGLPPEGRQDDH
jgi:succinyl-diaminopimelate desuccinylase